MQVEVNHVLVQITDDGLQLLPGIVGGVHLAQHQLDEMRHVLVLVRHFEREITDVTPGFGHQPASEVVQEVCLSAVGLSGADNQASLVGGVKYVVRQRAVAYVIPVVVFTVQGVQNLICPLADGDDIRGVLRACRFDNFMYHFHAVGGKYVGDILAVAGQRGEQAAGAEVVGQVFDECPSGQVAVSADYDVLHLVQPGVEGFETFGQVACRPVGHADDVRVSGFIQGQHVLSSFGDNQAPDVFFGHA